MWCQLQLTLGLMSKLVYCSRHVGIRTILNMFHEIQRIAQDYDNVHPTRGMERTKSIQIWEDMEKINVPCKPREPYHQKMNNTMILTMGNQMDQHQTRSSFDVREF